jgi:hypothetical protein
MQFVCTAWAEALNSRDDGRRKAYRSCQKHDSLSLYDAISTGRHLLGVALVTSLKSNFCTALTTQSTTENNSISHAQNMTVRKKNILCKRNTSLTGHKQEPILFPRRQQLPRSTANSQSVAIGIHLSNQLNNKPASWTNKLTKEMLIQTVTHSSFHCTCRH